MSLSVEGETLFERLRQVAVHHDARLRRNLTDEQAAQLSDLLGRLQAGLDEEPANSKT